MQIDGGVADVRLNRPDKLNALDVAMFTRARRGRRALAADPSVRAVVLSGEGRAFCAGLDFANFAAMAGDAGDVDGADSARFRRLARDITAREPGRITNLGQQAVHVWREMPQPVIAAVHGHALGGGLQIALGADIRIVAPDAKLSVLEIRWGLVPDMTGTAAADPPHRPRTWPRSSPSPAARWTARRPSASAWPPAPPTPRTPPPFELARDIASKSPDAIRGAKRLLNSAGENDLAEQFLEESRTLGELRGSPNQVEAVRAYFEKRAPAFTDPS